MLFIENENDSRNKESFVFCEKADDDGGIRVKYEYGFICNTSQCFLYIPYQLSLYKTFESAYHTVISIS